MRIKFDPLLAGFIKKELVQTLRDKRMRILLFALPVIQLTLFGLALSTDVRNLKLAVVYGPNDPLCRKIEDRCYGSGFFIKSPQPPGGDPTMFLRSGKEDAVLIAPEGGLTRALGDGRGAHLQLLLDAENILKAQSAEGYLQSVLNEALRDQTGQSPPPPPVSFSVRYLYNPELNSSYFNVPAVLCMILVITTMVLTSSSIAREKELGTFESLIASPAKPREILLGKTIPFVLLGMVEMLLVLAVAVFGFRVPLRGPLWMLLGAALAFIINTVSCGVLMSSFVKDQQQSAMFGFLFIFPAIQLSGLIYPIENMPWALKPFAYLDPVQYFVALLRNIMLKGGDSLLVGEYVGVLLLSGLLFIWIASKRFHQTLN